MINVKLTKQGPGGGAFLKVLSWASASVISLSRSLSANSSNHNIESDMAKDCSADLFASLLLTDLIYYTKISDSLSISH